MTRAMLLYTYRVRAQLADAGEGALVGALAALPPSYRTDGLLGLGADLSDVVALYAAGTVNETVVREAAVQVAAEAYRVYAASCLRKQKETGDGR